MGSCPAGHPVAMSMSPPVTATATQHPCQLYAHSAAPVPCRTQYHHRYPEYLQGRLWGGTRLEGGEHMLWVCGLCHDSIHEVLGWLLEETRRPDPMPGLYAVREATRTVLWYQQTLAQLGAGA